MKVSRLWAEYKARHEEELRQRYEQNGYGRVARA
jgi:hypothetical protein